MLLYSLSYGQNKKKKKDPVQTLRTYRKVSLQVKSLDKSVKAVAFCVDGPLILGDLLEEMGSLIKPELADVHILLPHALGPAFAVGG